MKDFSDFKKFLNASWQEVLNKATENADRRLEEFNMDDDLTKAYSYNRFINESIMFYTLEKYHEWLHQENETA